MILTGQKSVEAEQSVLGTALVEPKILDDIINLIDSKDFVINAHQLIWTGIKHLYVNNQPIDTLTVADMLTKYKRINDVGGSLYLSDLLNAAGTTGNALAHARIVHSEANRRRTLEGIDRIRELAESGELEDNDFFSEVERIALSLRPKAGGNMKHISDTRQEYMDFLATKDELIYTGFPKFDNWMGGVARGDLYVLAGRPSVGKTAKMLQLARGIAAQDAGEVLIWSQEMSRNKLLNRMIPSLTGINANRLRRKLIDAGEKQKITTAYDELQKLPLHIDDASGVRIEQIRAVARQTKRQYGRIAAIVVDYLQIMDIPQDKGQTRAQAVGHVTRTAKRIARELDCVFILLSQMSREGAKVEKPQLHHLRESGEIEQDADIVEFLWHDPQDKDNGGKVIQSFVAKGRDIGVADFRYLFKGHFQVYEELSGGS